MYTKVFLTDILTITTYMYMSYILYVIYLCDIRAEINSSGLIPVYMCIKTRL